MMKFKSGMLVDTLRVTCLLLIFLLGSNAQSQGANPSILVLGGASHTQSGFTDPKIQRFYTATAAKAAEQMADALTKNGIRNSKFIVWSRYEQYLQELGFNTAACDCNFLLQVSFGKNVDANPQTFFLEYQLLYLAQSHSKQPGFNAVTTQPRFSRRFDIPITNEILQDGKFPSFAEEISLALIQSKALVSKENIK